ncbi:MAG: mevalonate kinase [Herpetosiphon sp.]|nr:mevalonate kinase [Herpetosiphon sp.]
MESAPAKLILGGEHAVVYGQPAIAMPFAALRATVHATSAERGAGLTVIAPDLGTTWRLRAAQPLSDLAERTLHLLEIPEPDIQLTITSSIPIASGMGSGAAVGVALVRALAHIAQRELDPSVVSQLVYESEQAFHGTPSGIDNTVIAYEQPIVFQRQPFGMPTITPLPVHGSWMFVVADTGVASETKAVVGDLRQRWNADQATYDQHFHAIGACVWQMEAALQQHDQTKLGELLNQNHGLLQTIGVSSPELDRLVNAAQDAGALGAKMSGAGWGGIMLALVTPETSATVQNALNAASAVRTWQTELSA